MAPQRPKAKGTKAETDVARWAIGYGMYDAERLALKGTGDVGDVRLVPGVFVQVKDGYTSGKDPSDFLIGKWLDRVEEQRKAGGWSVGLLAHKRAGKGSPNDWRWYVDGRTFAFLLGMVMDLQPRMPPYIQLQGYMIPPLLESLR